MFVGVGIATVVGFGNVYLRTIKESLMNKKEFARDVATSILGRVGSDRLRIDSHGKDANVEVRKLENAWRSSLSQKLQAETMAADAE